MQLQRPLALMTLALTLVACGNGGGGTPATPAATSGTMNGSRVIDANTYQFGFTPLSGKDVVGTASIKSATVTELSSGAATASVCGQVQAQNVITTAITLDSTGSMSSTDPQKLRQTAANAFVNRLRATDQAAVLSFDSSTSPSSGMTAAKLWQNFTADHALLTTAVASATRTGGGTPLYDAVIDASKLVKAKGGSNPTVLVLTDGEDNDSDAELKDAIAAAKQNGTPVYAIGLDVNNSVDLTDLQTLASSTGGLFQKATSATQLQTFFDQMFNAFTAQGCVQLNFTNKPATGTTVTGKLNVTVGASNKTDAVVTTPFTLTVQ